MCGNLETSDICQGRILSRFDRRGYYPSEGFEPSLRLHQPLCHFPREYQYDEGYVHAFRICSAFVNSANEGGLFL